MSQIAHCGLFLDLKPRQQLQMCPDMIQKAVENILKELPLGAGGLYY